MADETPPWDEDELMGSTNKEMPSRWAQYENPTMSETHEANVRAVELAAERVANSPVRSGMSTPSDIESDEDSEEGYDDDEAIRLEALKMLEIADDHLSTPYSVRKTQSGGFSASYSGGFSGSRSSLGGLGSGHGSNSSSRRSSTSSSKRVPSALAGLDFTKRSSRSASYTSSPRSAFPGKDGDDEENNIPSYAEEDALVDVIEMENNGGTMPKKESKWSSRYSIDHTLLALSGGRSRSANVKDVLNHMERETDREVKTHRNLFIASPHDSPSVFGSGGFSFRDGFGKKPTTTPATATTTYSPDLDRGANIMAAFGSRDLDSNGRSLTPPEPRKTWQEQLERKKRQQRRWAILSASLCIAVGLLIGMLVSRSTAGQTKAAKTFASTATSTGSAGQEGLPDIVFYVTSDSPYDSSEEEKLSADLEALPSDAHFVAHLGNIQNSAVTLCSESRYSRVKDVLLQSPVPMFIVPGEEDWNNCPNPDDAWETWQANFESFEANFDHNFIVNRQMRRKENFAFLFKDVLFLGLHLVGGRMTSQEEWTRRLNDNVNWMESMVSMNQDNFQKIVLMGNARPGPQQRRFFNRMAEFLGSYELPIIYIHANSGVGGVMQYSLFDSDYIEGLQIEDGGLNPPLRISIYAGEEQPFVVG
ncbi:expressed unknown protein [Seminavis robusta]|uniref:Uncharacterized protein n=1 Tax=Seminavis robusta TaxID=568900 RepID=A0A9N8D8P3_9STRA|nr:expressed unknown protein [Seminavis robusta]|eukprot:Sro37_g023290.1 n/a (647) ;mRNA; r:97791-99731